MNLKDIVPSANIEVQPLDKELLARYWWLETNKRLLKKDQMLNPKRAAKPQANDPVLNDPELQQKLEEFKKNFLKRKK